MKKAQVKAIFLTATLATAVLCTFSLSDKQNENSSNFTIAENSAQATVTAETGDPCISGKGICVDGNTIHSDHYHK